MNRNRCSPRTIRSAALAAAGVLFLTFFGVVVAVRAQSAAPAPAEKAKTSNDEFLRKFFGDANDAAATPETGATSQQATAEKAELSSAEQAKLRDYLSSLTTEDGVKAAKAKTLAMLEQAKGEKIQLSRAEKAKVNTGGYNIGPDLNKCNQNDYDDRHLVKDAARKCSGVANNLKTDLGVTSHAAELAYLRACAFFSHYGADTNCADLGEFYMNRGDFANAIGVLSFAPNCNQPEPMVSYREACMDLGYKLSVKLADKHLQKSFSVAQCYRFSNPYACERVNREFGGSVDLAAARKQYEATQEKDDRDRDAAFAADEEDRIERQQAKSDKRDAVISALQSMPGASDPNAILNAATQQGAQMVAIGAANDAARREAAQARLESQQNSSRPAPASSSSSGVWNGLQNSQTATTNSAASASGNASSSNGFGATRNSASSATTAANYTAPLSASCIREFWDPNDYNWLSFQNTCSQPIRVDFIAANPDDTFGMSAKDLAPGQADSTGWSQTDVSRKRGFVLFVCPAGYLAVDSATDQPIRRANENFRCKQQ